MAALSDYLENALVNHIFRGGVGGTAFTQPTAIYLALFTTAPTDAGAGTEVSGGAYVRRQVNFTAPSNGATDNTSDLTYPAATADWGTISHFGLFDALTGGNMLIHGAFSIAKPIYLGDQFIVRAGDLDIQFN